MRRYIFLMTLLTFIYIACDEPEDYGPWHVYSFDELPENTNVTGIYFLSTSDGWGCAGSGTLFKYNGQDWYTYKKLVEPRGYIGLGNFDFVSAQDGWLVGSRHIGEPPPRAFIMRYDGVDWKEVPAPPDMYALGAVEALAPDNVWVGGTGGIWHYDGSSWTRTAVVDFVRSLYFNSPDDGWAAADFGLYFHWNGSSWEQVISGDLEAREDIFFPTPDEGWAVGGRSPFPESRVEYPIYHYTSATGRWDRWKHPPEAAERKLYGVHFASPDDGWAAGQVVLRWDGRDWRNVYCPYVAFDVFTLGGDEVWLACDDRKILKYDPK